MKRWLSPAWFALIAAAFFLPFVSISCQAPEGLGNLGGEGGQIPSGGFEIKATGWDLVTGAEPEVKSDPGFDELTGGQDLTGGEDSEPSLFAIIAFAAAVLGIFLSLLRGRAGAVLTLVLGGIVAVALFLLRNDISGSLPAEAATFLQVKYQSGYWAALLLGVIAAGWGVIRLLTPDEMGVPSPPGTGMPPPMASGTDTSGFGGTAPPPGPPPMPPGGGTQEPPPPA